MAIFNTGPDVSLPIIGQVMQARLDNQKELTSLWERAHSMAEYQGVEYLSWQTVLQNESYWNLEYEADLMGSADESGATIMGYADTRDYILAVFREACELCIKIVDSMYTTQQIPCGALEHIQKLCFYKRQRSFSVLLNHKYRYDSMIKAARGEEQPDEVYMPLDAFKMEGAKEPHEYISDEVCSLIIATQQGQAKLVRCPECEHLFIQKRGNQMYCSHRDAARAGQRQRRKTSKAQTQFAPPVAF